MDEQKFVQTANVLKTMQEELDGLQKMIEKKRYAIVQQRQSYKANMAEKNARLEVMRETVNSAALKTNEAIKKIEMVLNEDGSGNNNN